jgi:hypothetical protein
MKRLCFFVLFCLSSSGQTVKVVSLSDADARTVKTAKNALDAATTHWDAVQKDIEQRYISTKSEATTSSLLYGTGTFSNYITVDGAEPYHPCRDLGSVVPLLEIDKRLGECRQWLVDRDATEKRYEAERAKIPKHTVYIRKPGWENGFLFSEDFKFITPAPAPLLRNGVWNEFINPISIGR